MDSPLVELHPAEDRRAPPQATRRVGRRPWPSWPAIRSGQLRQASRAGPSTCSPSSAPSPARTCSSTSPATASRGPLARPSRLLGLRSVGQGPARRSSRRWTTPTRSSGGTRCEALMQQPAGEIPVDRLCPCSSTPTGGIRFAARVAIEHARPRAHRDELLALQDPRALSKGCSPWSARPQLDEAGQDELLSREASLLGRSRPTEASSCDLLRLIELTYLLGPRKAERRRPRTSLRPAAAEAVLDLEPTSPARIAGARAAARVPGRAAGGRRDPGAPGEGRADRPPQIHYAYCLRAIKARLDPRDAKRSSGPGTRPPAAGRAASASSATSTS